MRVWGFKRNVSLLFALISCLEMTNGEYRNKFFFIRNKHTDHFVKHAIRRLTQTTISSKSNASTVFVIVHAIILHFTRTYDSIFIHITI